MYNEWSLDVFYKGAEDPALQLDMKKIEESVAEYKKAIAALDASARLLLQAVRQKADIVIFGHTHNPYQEYIPQGAQIGSIVTDRPMWLFNPGSLRDDRRATFGTLEIRNSQPMFGFGEL